MQSSIGRFNTGPLVYLLELVCTAHSFSQGFDQVKQKYAELKRRMGQTSVQGVQGSRIQDIGMEANAIFEETLDMMLRMESKRFCAGIDRT